MNKEIFYCGECSELTEECVCSKCGQTTRAPKSHDMCFVDEFYEMGKSMFADALSSNDIEFVAVPAHGGASKYNTPKGYKAYVRYADYDQATEILNVLFGGDDEQPDDPASLIDRIVKVTIDRPQGTRHPEHPDIIYELDYGHVEGVVGGDGEEQDAYFLGLPQGYAFVGKEVSGFIVAVIIRKNDVETKWVVAPLYGGVAPRTPKYTKEQIEKAVHFQEKFFDIEIIM